jgi:hypothetical protein
MIRAKDLNPVYTDQGKFKRKVHGAGSAFGEYKERIH